MKYVGTPTRHPPSWRRGVTRRPWATTIPEGFGPGVPFVEPGAEVREQVIDEAVEIPTTEPTVEEEDHARA